MFACLIQNVRLNSYIMPCGKRIIEKDNYLTPNKQT